MDKNLDKNSSATSGLGAQLQRVADLSGMDPAPHRSRGALSNAPSRFIQRRSQRQGDNWGSGQADLGEFDEFAQAKPKTEFFPDQTRQLITRNRSPDIPFDRSINPYKGCEHGCIYCFARPTHAYLDLSAGLDFERKIFFKTNVVERLSAELRKPNYRCQPIAIGTNTDPYQPGEKQHRVMRQILERLLAHRHPVSIVTKGQLLARDLDLLAELAKLNLVKVMVSVTTLSIDLKTKLEPRTASPNVRLKLLQQLTAAGVPAGAMVAPVIPYINDAELDSIVDACVASGAQELRYILLRLPLEVKPLFEQWLQQHYPLRAAKVMNVLSDARGGKAYNSQWGTRMRGEGPFAELLHQRFKLALKRAFAKHQPKRAPLGQGIAPLDCDAFIADPDRQQMALF